MAKFATGRFFHAAAALITVAVSATVSRSQTIVKIDQGQTMPGPSFGPHDPDEPRIAAVPTCGTEAAATHGQPVPGGGTLNPVAYQNPTTVNGAGRVAFFAQVEGSPRNQGIFVADAGGLVPIAMGCGGGGGSGIPGTGCGDPSPIGGTFSGLFSGTVFAPQVNDAGDVLFVADVTGGSSPRGLFLHRATAGTTVKVAAVGDPSPLGPFLAAVGPGSLSNSGEVVFLARNSGGNVNVLRWNQGAVGKVAAVGDPAPGGGTFQLLGGEAFGFADGTSIPTGPVPGINDVGQVTFRAIVSGGSASRGIVVSTGGQHEWYVRAGDPTPGGGAYVDFQAASINAASQIAFFADFQVGPAFTSGWFVGRPGAWRKALAFFDAIETGQCFGLAFSRNPIRPLDDQGNLALWTLVKNQDQTEHERILLSPATGSLTTLAKQGDPAPGGGTFGALQAWPAVNDSGRVTVSAATPGAPAQSAHFTAQLCGPSITAVSPSSGPKAGGTFVALWGSGLSLGGLPTVTFGGAAAQNVSVLSDDALLVTTPPGAMGSVAVEVSTAFGSVVLANGFVYTPAVLVLPSSAAPGGAFTIENLGAAGESYLTWASGYTTFLPMPPFGTVLVVPEFELLGPAPYPFSGVASSTLVLPANPQLSGVTIHFQSLSFASLTPLVATCTNAAALAVR